MDLKDLDLNLLGVFEAIWEERSVTAAAQRRGLTQSAMSNALGRLRTQVGDPLFVRDGRGMAPTPRAEQLAPYVTDALGLLERGLYATANVDVATVDAEVRMFMTDALSMTLLPSLLNILAAEAPGVNVRLLLTETKGRELERLRRDDAQLAVGVYRSEGSPFRRRRLYNDTFRLVMRRDHPLADGPVDAADLAAYPHVLQSWRGDARGQLDAALEKAGHTRRVRVTTPYFGALAHLVARSDHLALVPGRFAAVLAAEHGLFVAACPLPVPSFSVRMWWTVRHDADPLHRWLRTALVRASASTADSTSTSRLSSIDAP
ncbi:MAG: LysR family transcriptional regulator [Myxococcota bacterium]